MTGVLGVPTISYLPFAFFNILNPVVALVFAFTGYRIEHLGPGGPEGNGNRQELVPGGDGHVE
jgi:hypothetical protein